MKEIRNQKKNEEKIFGDAFKDLKFIFVHNRQCVALVVAVNVVVMSKRVKKKYERLSKDNMIRLPGNLSHTTQFFGDRGEVQLHFTLLFCIYFSKSK